MTHAVPVIPYRTEGERASARERVAAHVAAGGLVAYPTETVYGLGCSLVPEGLRRLVALKGDRPFLLLVRDAAEVDVLDWSAAARSLARHFWPGPLTLALRDPTGTFPREVVGPQGLVAVRVSPHPAIPALLDAVGGPITSTSANPPGVEPARDARTVADALRAVPELLVLDGGPLPPGPPSTIVRCDGPVARILREGAVERSAIATTVELE
ncbi:MAG TPA: L-threonylcarbamoyladenylate synthase [Longimicrobiales bacterium]|nr:L-threonylcarbamoyladenylate synthase [Longimicrobiales bacterium]